MDFVTDVRKRASNGSHNDAKSLKQKSLCCLKISRKNRQKKSTSFALVEDGESYSMTNIYETHKSGDEPILQTILRNIKKPNVYRKSNKNSAEKTSTNKDQIFNNMIQELKTNTDQSDTLVSSNGAQPMKKNIKSQIYKLQLCETKLNDLFGYNGDNGLKDINMNQINERNLTNYDVNCLLDALDDRIDSLRWKAESANYLQWLGIFTNPNGKQCGVPGITANPPNPYLAGTRLTDSEIRITFAEHQKVCLNPIDKDLKKLLRSTEFDNWLHSDAMLMRLLREMYTELDLVEPSLPIRVEELDSWLQSIYKHYNQVPFHNFKHAFMVTQMSYVLITNGNLSNLLDKFDQCVLITAAICHDLDHPGFNNSYQINAKTQLALRYNDRSPLENHHASTAFSILYCEGLNPFRFDGSNEKNFREAIIKCILATDMSSHNEILTTFTEKVLNNKTEMLSIDPESGKPKWTIDKLTRYLVMSILIKVSDISNESRPIYVAAEWIDRLLEEFFIQSDFEKKSNLPYAPFMDRAQVSKPASQCSFIQFVILPLFKSLCDLIPQLEPIIIAPALNQLDYYTKLLPKSEDKPLTIG